MNVLSNILDRSANGEKMFAVLVDPDKYDHDALLDLVKVAENCSVHYFFVGGSLMTSDRMEQTVAILKELTNVPVIIFPGSSLQITSSADAILFLSMISGRNPDLLIGQHVVAAPYIRNANLETLPTGYMLIGNDIQTTANYMSNTLPIPTAKPEIAASTAMAGEMLGLKLIYMDGGSGAQNAVTVEMIEQVKHHISIPLIVGGGIRDAEQARVAWDHGADVVVVGNAIEDDLNVISEISSALKSV